MKEKCWSSFEKLAETVENVLLNVRAMSGERERDAFNPSLNLSNLYNSGREVNQLANIQSL